MYVKNYLHLDMSKEKKNKKINELEQKISELTAGWQRTQADFENYKKQASSERIKLIENANADLLYDLLPVLDNFQLAAKHLPKDHEKSNWAVGIQQIEKQFENILNQSGLIRIESVGTEFNPELHEAVEEVQSNKKSGTIIDEILTGYKYNDQVLRPAKVKVAK